MLLGNDTALLLIAGQNCRVSQVHMYMYDVDWQIGQKIRDLRYPLD